MMVWFARLNSYIPTLSFIHTIATGYLAANYNRMGQNLDSTLVKSTNKLVVKRDMSSQSASPPSPLVPITYKRKQDTVERSLGGGNAFKPSQGVPLLEPNPPEATVSKGKRVFKRKPVKDNKISSFPVTHREEAKVEPYEQSSMPTVPLVKPSHDETSYENCDSHLTHEMLASRYEMCNVYEDPNNLPVHLTAFLAFAHSL